MRGMGGQNRRRSFCRVWRDERNGDDGGDARNVTRKRNGEYVKGDAQCEMWLDGSRRLSMFVMRHHETA